MLREQRDEVFYEFFGSKKRKEKKEKREEERKQKFEENKKLYNSTKPKLKKYITKIKSLILSNMKEYNQNFEGENVKASFNTSNKEDKSKEYEYQEKITISLFTNKRELDWNGYDEIVTPAKDTISDMLVKDGLDKIVEIDGKYDEFILVLRFNETKGLDRKKY